jgi:exosome complex component RRP43
MEFPPMCSASTRPGRPNDESSFIARRIEDALVDSRAVDLKKLSIKTGLWAWRVCLDIYCLDHDGSVLDAGLMAALAALRDTKVPFVAVDDRGKLTYGGVGEKKKRTETETTAAAGRTSHPSRRVRRARSRWPRRRSR